MKKAFKWLALALLVTGFFTIRAMADGTVPPVPPTGILGFLQLHWAEIGTFLFFLSEALAQIPAIKSNSVFELIYNTIRKFFGQPQITPPKT